MTSASFVFEIKGPPKRGKGELRGGKEGQRAEGKGAKGGQRGAKGGKEGSLPPEACMLWRCCCRWGVLPQQLMLEAGGGREHPSNLV